MAADNAISVAPGVPDGLAKLVKENGRWRVDDF